MIKKLKNLLKPRLELVKGTRFVSFLFIGSSVLIAAGILFAANMYYNIDTGEVVMEEIQRVTGLTRAIGGLIVRGTATATLPSGVGLQVAADDVLLSAANQLLRFSGGTGHYVGFRADTGITTTTIYTWPTAYPAASGRVLQSTTGGVLSWLDLAAAGLGDVLAVGDCPSGECFTADGLGNTLWFEGATADTFEIALTAADPTADFTITLPAATGMVALGTGTTNHVAYWTGTSTLAGEQFLATSRGGIGANSSAWNGMIRVVGGAWGPITGTSGHVAFWADANTIGAEPFLATSRGGLGGDVTAAGAGEIVYSTGAATYDNLAAGTAWQVLTSGGAAVPVWRNISALVLAGSGLTATGVTTTTLRLGGALTETTTITQGAFDMIYNLTGTGDFRVQDAGTDILTVTDDGRILFKTYPLAETGKQVLREMIPIFGFDLPSQTATTSWVKISRLIENYPFAATSTGATRVHKLVFRYAASTTNPIDLRINAAGSPNYATTTLPIPQSTSLDDGEARIFTIGIPTDGTDWQIDVKTVTDPDIVRIYQIFLAAYDQLQ